MFHHPSMIFQQCWKVLKYFFSNTAMVLNWHHSRLDLYWIQSGVNLLHRSFYSVGLIEYRRMTSQNFFLDFSVLDTMYRWSMIKNIHSPNWVGIGSRGPRDMAAWIPNWNQCKLAWFQTVMNQANLHWFQAQNPCFQLFWVCQGSLPLCPSPSSTASIIGLRHWL